MQVVTVRCLKDNFAYLVIEGDGAVVIDPSEAAPVEAALLTAGVTLRAIWATHHHWDHTGGIAGLVGARAQGALEVVIGAEDAAKVAHVTRTVADGDELEFGSLRARVLHNPGHTLGAVTFLIAGCAFTGDTLFGAGCGRVFEGDPAMMHASLMRLGALPPETQVFCGHEYTASNLRFAAAVEPKNAAITARAHALPSPSVPSTIGQERETNPFLRATAPDVIATAVARGAAPDPVSVFAELRAWKNTF